MLEIDNYLKSEEVKTFVGEDKNKVSRDDAAGYVRIDVTDRETKLDSMLEAVFEIGNEPVCVRRVIREFPNFVNHRVVIRGYAYEGPIVTIMRASGSEHVPGEPPIEFEPNLLFRLSFQRGSDQQFIYSSLYQLGLLTSIEVRMNQLEQKEDEQRGKAWKTVARLRFGGLDSDYCFKETAEPVELPGTNSTVAIAVMDQMYFLRHRLPIETIDLSYPKWINKEEWIERVEKEDRAGKALLTEAPPKYHFSFSLGERNPETEESY